jgi:hypothetical protein
MPYKKYSPKQKKLAAVAKPRKKITGADFKKLRKKKIMKHGKKYVPHKGASLYANFDVIKQHKK